MRDGHAGIHSMAAASGRSQHMRTGYGAGDHMRTGDFL